jgi:hypothetical protein
MTKIQLIWQNYFFCAQQKINCFGRCAENLRRNGLSSAEEKTLQKPAFLEGIEIVIYDELYVLFFLILSFVC